MRPTPPDIAASSTRSLAEPALPAREGRWRYENPGRVLFAAADRFVADKLALLRPNGPVPTPALAILFEHLDQGGTRPSVLAERAGVTRSSMTELIARAIAMRLVERRPDPDDARARAIAFTPAGLVLQQRLRAGVLGAERAMTRAVGTVFVGRLKAGLSDYLAADGIGPSIAPANPAWRRLSIGRALPSAARLFARDTLAVVRRHGFGEVNEGVLGLCRLLDGDGTRLTELARRARMTKPAMAELVTRADALTLVERLPDPTDGRARAIRFTPHGFRLLDAARTGVAEAEARMVAVTGAPFVVELVAGLSAYAADRPSRARA